MYKRMSDHRKQYGLPPNNRGNKKFTIMILFIIGLLIIKNLLQ